MPPPSPLVGTASITENMLKRKWSASILQYLVDGVTDPAEIAKHEPDLSPAVMSERLRAMLRYNLIARFPRPAPSKVVEFRPTPRGKKILKMLDVIDRLDQLDQQLAVDGKSIDENLGLDLAPMSDVSPKAEILDSGIPNKSKKLISSRSRPPMPIHPSP
jgi:DNA-binding HxlR family transcriptional regulator